MKKLVTTLALLAFCATASHAANQVRISQVYGGGGATSGTPTFNQDYVEIFNSGATAVDLSGWALEYGSATGNWGSSAMNIFNFPQGASIAPCSYVLIGLSSGSVGPNLAPAPDYTGTLGLSATTGKVALFTATNANLACGSEIGGTLVDKVSFGGGNCPENTNVGFLTNASAAVRNNGGLDDTDHNLNDFTIVVNATPRNSASPPNTSCLATPASASSWGAVKSIYRN